MPFTRLRYHIVTATHNREPSITSEVEPLLYTALHRQAEDLNGHVLRVGGVADHVHIVAAIRPATSVADFVKTVKAGSSRAVRRAFGTPAFQWQRGYSAFTLNPNDLGRILAYVARQKEHHACGELWPAYERVADGG